MQELHNQGMAQTKLSYGANARVKLHSQVHFKSKKIYVQKSFSFKKIVDPKKLWVQNILDPKILSQKKSWVQTFLG